MSRHIAAYSLMLGFALTLSACNSMGASGTMPAPEPSLYERLGGKTAITPR